MTDINTQSQQTLDSLLTKLGAKKVDTSATPAKKTALGQEDFLKLMTAQLSNQDPFQPQSNDQMIAQMAQFSTVTGITQLNTTMTGLQSTIADNDRRRQTSSSRNRCLCSDHSSNSWYVNC